MKEIDQKFPKPTVYSFSFFYLHASAIVTSKSFHIVFIILEYFPCLISSLCITQKMTDYPDNLSLKSTSAIMETNYYNKLNIFFYASTADSKIQHICSILIFSLVIVFLILFVILKAIHEKLSLNTLTKILLNFYDLFFFRYLSGFITFSFIHLFSLIVFRYSPLYYFLAFIVLAIFFFYLILCYNFISNNFVSFHVKNPFISKTEFEYPFDSQFSQRYEFFLFCIKILCSIEEIYFLNSEFPSYPIIAIQVSYYMVFLTLVFSVIADLITKDLFETGFIINTIFNLTRLTLMLFNFYSILYLFFFPVKKLQYIKILTSIVVSFLAGMLSALFFKEFVDKKIHYNQELTMPKIIYLLTNRHNKHKMIVKYFLEKRKKVFQESTKKRKNDHPFLRYLKRKMKLILENERKELINKEMLSKYEHYSNIFYLFYYHIRSKRFKFHTFYRNLVLQNTKKHLREYKYVFQICLKQEPEDEAVNLVINQYKGIFILEKINSELTSLLLILKEFIDLPNELKYPSYFLKISEKYASLRKEISVKFLENFHLSKNAKQKNLLNVEIYNVVLTCFIGEKLMRYYLNNCNSFDIEQFEDFLNFHFKEDNFVILTYDKFSHEKEKFPIIKCGAEISKIAQRKFLIDLFPKDYLEIGLKKFNGCVKVAEDASEEVIFEFLIKSFEQEGYLDYFCYNFKVSKIFINQKLVIFGFHKQLSSQKIILFQNFQSKYSFINFSFSNYKIFAISPKNLEEIYSMFSFLRNKISFFFSSCNIIDEVHEKLELTFDTQFFYKNLKKLLDANKIKSFKNALRFVPDIRHLDLKYKMSIRKLLSIQLSVSIEHEAFLVTELTDIGSNKKSTEMILKTMLADDYFDANMISTGSVSSMSMISQETDGKNKKIIGAGSEMTNNLFLSAKEIDHFNKNFKRYTFFYYLTLLLNIIGILCFICFLIIQTIVTNKMIKINILYYQFSNLRVQFEEAYLALVSNICYAKENEDGCVNFYSKYSDYMIQTKQAQLNIKRYLFLEIPFKLDLIANQLNVVSNLLYDYDNGEYIEIFTQKLNFVNYANDHFKNEIIKVYSNQSFYNGFREFLSSILLIINSERFYDSVPIYQVSVNNKVVDFSKVKGGLLSDFQEGIYSILSNYVNLYRTIFQGRQKLLSGSEKMVNLNQVYIFLFTNISILLIIIVLGFSIYSIIAFNKVSSELIIQMKKMLSNENFMQFFRKKIKTLHELAKLYVISPSDCFQKLKSNEKEFNRFYKKKRKNQVISAQVEQEPELSIKTQRNQEHYKEITYYSKKYVNKIIIYYLIYLLFEVVFEVILVVLFGKFKSIDNFVFYYPSYEIDSYSSLLLPQIMLRMNFTEAELQSLLGNEKLDACVSTDSLINGMVRSASSNYLNLTSLRRSAGIEYFDKYFTDYSCEYIFRNIHDDIIEKVIESSNSTVIDFLIEMCEHFQVTSLNNFIFIPNDMALRLQMTSNSLMSRTSEDIYNFLSNYELYALSSAALLNLRPISSFLRNEKLVPRLRKEMYFLMDIVILYLICNIFFSILIFALLRYTLIEKLNKVIDNLRLLDNALWI